MTFFLYPPPLTSHSLSTKRCGDSCWTRTAAAQGNPFRADVAKRKKFRNVTPTFKKRVRTKALWDHLTARLFIDPLCEFGEGANVIHVYSSLMVSTRWSTYWLLFAHDCSTTQDVVVALCQVLADGHWFYLHLTSTWCGSQFQQFPFAESFRTLLICKTTWTTCNTIHNERDFK